MTHLHRVATRSAGWQSGKLGQGYGCQHAAAPAVAAYVDGSQNAAPPYGARACAMGWLPLGARRALPTWPLCIHLLSYRCYNVTDVLVLRRTRR
jgi:hypothetical protein